MEAIKGAVQNGLGVAFVSVLAIEKELKLGLVARVRIEGVRLPRTLWLVTHPTRTLSQAGQKFLQEVFIIEPKDSTDSSQDSQNGSIDAIEEGSSSASNNGRLPKAIPLRMAQTMPWENRVSSSTASDES